MASKKELMKRIEELEARLLQLENMHARIVSAYSWQSTRFSAPDPSESYIYDGKEGKYCGRQLTAAELEARYEHPLTKERTAWTRLVSGVTHEELAQYVLDGTPIKRDQAMPAAKIEYAPTSYAGMQVSVNIKTPKGEINV